MTPKQQQKETFNGRHLFLTESQRRHFIRDNRGAFTRIAYKLGLTRNHVRQVFYGLRRSSAVSAALDQAVQAWKDGRSLPEYQSRLEFLAGLRASIGLREQIHRLRRQEWFGGSLPERGQLPVHLL